MKRKNLIWLCYFIVFGFLLIFVSSCKKSDTTPPEVTDNATDKDGNTYHTVTIGTQTWFSENLKTTKFNNGDAIPTTTLDISTETTPKYQWAYGDDPANASIYGRLYTWYAVTDTRNLCPTGWHVPSDVEWEALKSFLGGEILAGAKLKVADTLHWKSPNTGATNETLFNALPGGYRTVNGAYVSIRISCYLWSTTDDNPLGWGQSLHYNDNSLLRGGYLKQAGVSVRCVKDAV